MSAQPVSLESKIAGEDLSGDVMRVENQGLATHINTATTTVIKRGAGHLKGFLVSGATLGSVWIYDNTSASAPLLIQFSSTMGEGWFPVGINFTKGLTVVTGSATRITVVYR